MINNNNIHKELDLYPTVYNLFTLPQSDLKEEKSVWFTFPLFINLLVSFYMFQVVV